MKLIAFEIKHGNQEDLFNNFLMRYDSLFVYNTNHSNGVPQGSVLGTFRI